jgi:hypothetical protein
MILPERPDTHHPHAHRPGVACLACQRDRRRTACDWPPAWGWRYGEPWSWVEADRSCWAPEWRHVRLLLGWPS